MTTNSLRASLAGRFGALEVEVALDTGAGPLVLVGPNGAGKTTVLQMLLGALAVQRGRVEVGSSLLFDTTRGVDLSVEQRQLGYVPQDYALFPHMTVAQNLQFAVSSARSREARQRREKLRDSLLAEFELDGVLARRATQLSGGEKQRIALVRALSTSPRALLLDEPLAALDAEARSEVRTFLARYLARLELPTIVVTHDADDAVALAHRVAVLENGRLVQHGSWAELAAHPASRFVEELISTRTRRRLDGDSHDVVG